MRIHSLIIFILIATTANAQKAVLAGNNEERFHLATALEHSLRTELLDKWYPQSIDSLYGGFLSTFTYDFKPTGPQDKFIVTQARHTWTNAMAAKLYPEKAYYLAAAEHGFNFLRDVMWDKTYGGFYGLVTRQGVDKSNPVSPKEAYGNAFAIYALAAYYSATGDTAALGLAKQTFMWLETHSHDPLHKGYFQHLQRDGTPVVRGLNVSSNAETGYKDQNSSIHLLEAFTDLYKVWPDKLVRERLQEMLLLIRDKITTPKGYLVLFFQPDWTPVSFRDSSQAFILKHKNLDHVSFGHDIETAYLMLEASHALGIKHDEKTNAVEKKMVDHVLKNGWDKSVGGIYDEGYYFKNKPAITIVLNTKNWWAQAEAMNTLLLMADKYPNDPMHYYEKFKQQWSYIQTYLIDHVNGGWYDSGLDKDPSRKTALKGQIWKGAYHNFRSLANCVKQLKDGGNESSQ
ncbi:MAG: AGE family epimerase/isomerase [Ferruginibacter sp.]